MLLKFNNSTLKSWEISCENISIILHHMISVKFYPKTNKKEEQNRLIKKLLMGIIEF